MIKSLERILGHKILSANPVSGGSIADSQKITTSAAVYFAKISKEPTSQFREEAAGLRALAEAVDPRFSKGGPALRIPAVHHADDHFLVLEWIDNQEPAGAFWKSFGTALAKLHKISQDQYGFESNNHIGTTPQTNPQRAHKEISWGEYFIEYRLKPMLAHQNLSVESLLQIQFQKTLPKIREALSAVKEPPSLVHGDLWGGNFLCDMEGRPVLIDPAVYRGHREVDLAMSELFGGFAPEFYMAYKKEFPLSAGYDGRRGIYNLYHLFNHWIIFGAASYRDKTMAALAKI